MHQLKSESPPALPISGHREDIFGEPYHSEVSALAPPKPCRHEDDMLRFPEQRNDLIVGL